VTAPRNDDSLDATNVETPMRPCIQRASVDQRLLDGVGRAMGRFTMLRPGDRVAVGVSGGKDSLCLLHALVTHQRRAPFTYELVAVTIEQGKFTTPVAEVATAIRALGVEWARREDAATLRLVSEGVVHGCDVCSRHRRRSLYQAAAELNCTVLALGHTADDCAEALLRNILFNGRIASLPPVARSRNGSLRLIRPLVYVKEALTAEYARSHGFGLVGCVCGEKDSVRREIREFLAGLRTRHPGVAESVSAALGNVNPYTLFDPELSKDGADASPAFAGALGESCEPPGAARPLGEAEGGRGPGPQARGEPRRTDPVWRGRGRPARAIACPPRPAGDPTVDQLR
jgi:tRNA 2-thiocytidine biosynthesis protein TtcA